MHDITQSAARSPPDDCEKGGHDPAKTKAELIKYLKHSFDYSSNRGRSAAREINSLLFLAISVWETNAQRGNIELGEIVGNRRRTEGVGADQEDGEESRTSLSP